MTNPFSTTFSKAPNATYISTEQEKEIIENFSSGTPTESVMKITGVRGSGKTVIMAKVEEEFRSEEKAKQGWIVLDLNPERDLLFQMASFLAKAGLSLHRLQTKNIDLSASSVGVGLGASFSTSSSFPTDIGTILDEMLQNAKKKEKKILICIDEMSKTKTMVEFVSEFGRWLRADYPIYLLCTGLYENMMELSSVKNLTFFLRASNTKTEPLNSVRMTDVYARTLSVGFDTAKELAKQTKGYAYAFQILGRFYFAKTAKESMTDVLQKTKIELWSYSYEKIYEEMSLLDRSFCLALNGDESKSRKEILFSLGEDEKNCSVYRDRLLKRGILISPSYGNLAFALPYFGEYLKEYYSN